MGWSYRHHPGSGGIGIVMVSVGAMTFFFSFAVGAPSIQPVRKKKRKKKTSHPPQAGSVSRAVLVFCVLLVTSTQMDTPIRRPTHRLEPLSVVPTLPAIDGHDPETMVASPLAPLPSEAGERRREKDIMSVADCQAVFDPRRSSARGRTGGHPPPPSWRRGWAGEDQPQPTTCDESACGDHHPRGPPPSPRLRCRFSPEDPQPMMPKLPR